LNSGRYGSPRFWPRWRRRSRIPLPLIDQHVDAIRAIVREHARPDAEQIAFALTQKLWEVSEEFLTAENKDRPEYLAGILSPPLAPDGNS
jgi:hypothetical protein